LTATAELALHLPTQKTILKISVITVAYNSARTLGDTLKSVAAQSHPDVEHLLIDGGSTDGTADLVRLHGQHLARYVCEPDCGIYDAMNKGLATGDVVGFLNSDDIYAGPTALASVARGLADPAVDAVFGDLVFVDPVDTSRVMRYWKASPHKPGACGRGWMPPHPTLYVRRSVLQECGGFNLAYRLQADFELILRLFELQHLRAAYLPEVLVRMRMGGATTGSVRNVLRGNLEAARACRQHGLPGGWTFIARKIASRIPQFLRRPTPMA